MNQESVLTASAPDNDGDNLGRRLLYGRRRGHKLRAHQQQLIDEYLPALAVPVAGPIADPRALFAGRNGENADLAVSEVWLEIGFGGGEHMLAQAAAHPGIGIIGCEPFINGMAQALASIEREATSNIRLHMGDAREVMARLPDASLDRVFLLYPDPWPKKRHHKRRFISRDTLDELARVLRDGAEFRVASDIADYCRWTLARVRAHDAFEWCAERPQDWREPWPDWPGTRYEAKAIAAGRRPSYLTFRRRPRKGA